ncbi:MAG: Asp-tRNA(Asn)/Glu-tRNA(Gln) amidotransferase subunit GatB [Ignavibacteriaceae bacterium]|nr:Asp-tRNA(Asn)/Glu-tRNA(Gln) amidotransferase subunit GatB [Ignavibacteriaceae bacterium]
MNSKYEPVIGLEVHAQLLTDSKAFCSCSTKFGNEPNSNTCPVCLGHPGVLPVLNKKVVEFTMLMGLATNCRVNKSSIFARKNYFYPDLPKGYQISQYEEPLCEDGVLRITKSDGTSKEIRIKRIHMEEDAGKSIHDMDADTLIDVNRCGVPLIEIVSEPDLRSAEDAYLYLNKIRQILLYLGICDGNMEEGSLRCDANISVRLKNSKELGVKTEIKNMNSFRNVEKAINFEIERQIDILEDGGKIIQQTLLWNADNETAYPMRSKEEAHDYRYFPDPDLIPVLINQEWKNLILSSLPELPDEKRKRFLTEYGLPEYDCEILTQTKAIADYFERVANTTKDFKSASNWVMVDVMKILNERKISIADFSLAPEYLGEMINLINDGTISSKIAKEIFPIILESNKKPSDIIKEKNLVQLSDESEIQKIIEAVIANNKEQFEELAAGKEKIFGFFVGQVMKETKGKANPKLVNDLLRKRISK